MRWIIDLPVQLERAIRAHLFQSSLEQGAFLFARVEATPHLSRIRVNKAYLVPPGGWRFQGPLYLELKDEERAHVMQMAREAGYCLIDCHSHPDSGDYVEFSSSDVLAITEFASYVRWKLDARPYIAMVWSKAAVDAVVWHGDFTKADFVNELHVTGHSGRVLIPAGSWPRLDGGGYRND